MRKTRSNQKDRTHPGDRDRQQHRDLGIETEDCAPESLSRNQKIRNKPPQKQSRKYDKNAQY